MRIDAHMHFTPAEYHAELGERGLLSGLGDPAQTRAFLQGLFYDTALATDPPALAAARDFAGATQVVLGSDWPYVDAIDDAAASFGANGAALLRRQLHGVR